jgi:two-component system nitrogen regulation response regulator GlnG
MEKVLEEIILQRRSDAIMTLVGEPGVGKEGLARFAHEMRRDQRGAPFVSVNMAGIGVHLFESELFGHARGAFTGANGSRTGRFEEARDGTIFLDEIGDMPLENQGLLLRVLSRVRTFSRVGENQQLQLNAKVVCATNADIHAAARVGKMRQDLHDRLCECMIAIPPLRERTVDHRSNLVRYLFGRIGMGLGVESMDGEAFRILMQTPIEGNVRGLENLIRRACHYASVTGMKNLEERHVKRACDEMQRSNAPQDSGDLMALLEAQVGRDGLKETVEQVKELLAFRVWLSEQRNYRATAERLKMDVTTLRRLISAYQKNKLREE